MNFTEQLTPANIMLAIVLFIQVYKMARPFLMKTEKGAEIVKAVDKGYDFVWNNAPVLYQVVEAMAVKGIIKGDSKPVKYLEELRTEALKQGVQLTPQHEAEAQLIAKGMAAADHQPKISAGVPLKALPDHK